MAVKKTNRPIGDEYAALPWCPVDPVFDDELTRKSYVDKRIDELQLIVKNVINESMLYVGRQELSPFRADSLPSGWYCMNGQKFLDTSPQGVALLGLPQTYRDDWGIVHGTDYMVNVPNFFSGNKGYFVRAVDGTTRQVGNIQNFANGPINISSSGSFGGVYGRNNPSELVPQGAFSGYANQYGFPAEGRNENLYYGRVYMNLSASNTADETRPLNIGMTPCIYLGV